MDNLYLDDLSPSERRKAFSSGAKIIIGSSGANNSETNTGLTIEDAKQKSALNQNIFAGEEEKEESGDFLTGVSKLPEWLSFSDIVNTTAKYMEDFNKQAQQAVTNTKKAITGDGNFKDIMRASLSIAGAVGTGIGNLIPTVVGAIVPKGIKEAFEKKVEKPFAEWLSNQKIVQDVVELSKEHPEAFETAGDIFAIADAVTDVVGIKKMMTAGIKDVSEETMEKIVKETGEKQLSMEAKQQGEKAAKQSVIDNLTDKSSSLGAKASQYTSKISSDEVQEQAVNKIMSIAGLNREQAIKVAESDLIKYGDIDLDNLTSKNIKEIAEKVSTPLKEEMGKAKNLYTAVSSNTKQNIDIDVDNWLKGTGLQFENIDGEIKLNKIKGSNINDETIAKIEKRLNEAIANSTDDKVSASNIDALRQNINKAISEDMNTYDIQALNTLKNNLDESIPELQEANKISKKIKYDQLGLKDNKDVIQLNISENGEIPEDSIYKLMQAYKSKEGSAEWNKAKKTIDILKKNGIEVEDQLNDTIIYEALRELKQSPLEFNPLFSSGLSMFRTLKNTSYGKWATLQAAVKTYQKGNLSFGGKALSNAISSLYKAKKAVTDFKIGAKERELAVKEVYDKFMNKKILTEAEAKVLAAFVAENKETLGAAIAIMAKDAGLEVGDNLIEDQETSYPQVITESKKQKLKDIKSGKVQRDNGLIPANFK